MDIGSNIPIVADVMIRHIVMFSAKDAQDIPLIEEGLRLLADIPEHSHFEVARNLRCDQLGNDIGIVVYAEFPDEAALMRYKEHPLYEESIRKVRPLRELRIAADIVAA